MSVYTVVERKQLETFLTHYSLGNLIDFHGISDGIENTNYFVTTTQGEFVLTLFESLNSQELPYFLELMAYLAEHKIPSAHPQPDDNKCFLRELNGKPATLVNKLEGKGVTISTVTQCYEIGSTMAKMHLAGQDFSFQRNNERGPEWWHQAAQRLNGYLTSTESTLLKEELHFQDQFRSAHLPKGVIHADLFRDNALFVGEKLYGLIDFYYACNDVLIYDLAVAVNDWCGEDDGSLHPEKLEGLLAGYSEIRPLTEEEKTLWPVMLRAGALRFWLSRLQDKHFPRPGELTHIKNPDTFRRVLENRKS
ncbi:MAG TPA: homoserine kinase [Thermodesulforhabdus norvegica]|uniref:Homoserine kinase n=1 Tax=Thermodesulforhabdus norvegica TaxID=39841 RepID=A0A7C1AZQ3_9BACT|nr:homoserine kinase [Thermodesulforhabdus norvegica]